MSLLVVGSIAFDSVETPTGSAEDVLGGSATYFAYAASFFAPVRLVGVVGEDFPGAHREMLAARQIDLAGLETAAGETFRWSGVYADDMNQRTTKSVALNVFGEFDPKLPEAYRDSQFVFLANGAPSVQLKVLEQVSAPQLVVADTMNLWIETTRDETLELLSKVDGMVLNDEEAYMLTDERNLVAAGRRVLAMGPSFVVVKKGEHGSLLITATHVVAMPAVPIDRVIDPTGAGDSFAGGMMGYLASLGTFDEQHLKRAIAYGSVIASFNCEDFSLNRFLNIAREDIDRRMGEYTTMLTM